MATNLTTLFTNIANAIRAKTGSSEQIVAENFPTAIAGIETTSDPVLTLVTVTDNTTMTVPSSVNRDKLIGFYLATCPPPEANSIFYAQFENNTLSGKYGTWNSGGFPSYHDVAGNTFITYNPQTGVISVTNTTKGKFMTNSEFYVITE